ncbi:tyrosine-protein kinase family protein [Thaumasiovibrio subtropicus]|uniref:tyrosine-protein kinase family protein n=1 Tax=Thaumasiovibrio subtropicus TaxID=1891207 RepID=UPI000B361283|nr:tyrosine-protein kinase family protein [Thaumasiovibrio subtropicus]
MKPWLSQEFDLLFQQIYQTEAKVITVTGANRECGTSTVCRWLAERFSGEHASVLLVDFDLSGSGQGFEKMRWQLEGEGQTEAFITLNAYLTLLPQPADPATLMHLRQPQQLNKAMTKWRQQFDYVLCDAGTVNASNWRNLPAAAIGAISDGTILCLAAAHTHENALQQSIQRLEQGNVPLIGTVINDLHYPCLAQEITRVINQRIPWLPESLRYWLVNKVNNSPLLQGEYQQ